MTRSELIAKEILWPDPSPQAGLQRALVFTNCTGRALSDYLRRNEGFRSRFNLDALETAPIFLETMRGSNVFAFDVVRALFRDCDVLITNNMGARHGDMALENIRPMLSSSAKTITFVATNFSCLWPLSYGYGGMLGVERLLDQGATVDDVWEKLKDGTFDPEFSLRWRIEMGRLIDKATYHDIDIHHFISQNVKRVKLFTASSHPTYHIVAHVGARICDILGIGHENIEANLAHDCMDGTMRGWPETHYEWAYYKMEYRKTQSEGFDDWYLPMLHHAAAGWQQGALLSPPRD